MNHGWRELGHGLIAFVFGCLALATAQDTTLVARRAKFDADILGSTLPVLKQQVVELAAL
jgi:hypothetical protein